MSSTRLPLVVSVAFAVFVTAITDVRAAPFPQDQAAPAEGDAPAAAASEACVASDGTSCSTLSSLSTGRLIGYAIGALIGVAALGAGIVIFMKWKRQQHNSKDGVKGAKAGGSSEKQGAGRKGASKKPQDDDDDYTTEESESEYPDSVVDEKKHRRKGSSGSSGSRTKRGNDSAKPEVVAPEPAHRSAKSRPPRPLDRNVLPDSSDTDGPLTPPRSYERKPSSGRGERGKKPSADWV